MTTELKSRIDDYVSSWREMASSRDIREPEWLGELRQRSLDRFAELGFPSHRQDEWKYNNLKSLPDISFKPAPANGAASGVDPAVWEFEGLDAHLMVFLDGHYQPALSRLDELPDGVSLAPLSELWSNPPEDLQKEISRLADAGTQPFTALNTAFMSDGVYLKLEKGARLDRPIHMLHLSGAASEPVLSCPRCLVLAEENSEATLIENHVSLGAGLHFVNTVSEIVLGDNARIRHIKIQRQNEASYHVGATAAVQGKGSRYQSWEISLGGSMARKEILVRLAGENGRCELNSLYLGRGEQRLDNRTRVVHEVPNCSTREIYKGILDEKAQGIFDGYIYVAQDAQQTDAQQTNRNLLLSEDALANSLPQLEIYADDVKCTHGATTGALDDEQIFYLRSRGFKLDSARALLTYAFASEIIEGLNLEPVKRELERELLERLPQGELVRESL